MPVPKSLFVGLLLLGKKFCPSGAVGVSNAPLTNEGCTFPVLPTPETYLDLESTVGTILAISTVGKEVCDSGLKFTFRCSSGNVSPESLLSTLTAVGRTGVDFSGGGT